MKYNEALKEAGVLITLDGLHPPSMGTRISFTQGRSTVINGPFIATNEVIEGYSNKIGSKAEAAEWAARCPAGDNEIIEIRQVQKFVDFPEDVQKAAAGFQEMYA